MSPLTAIARDLRRELAALRFGPPVSHVYNPLEYAWEPHRCYLECYGAAPKEVLFLGMNPGPFGMAQTGVPFGEVTAVRDWLEIEAPVERPADEHPKRLVEGFAHPRSEVSGHRLWGWARRRFGTPERFFARFFVHNYCPLLFLETTGKNRTPDRLPAEEATPLFAACDRALARTAEHVAPRWVIGVGRFATRRAETALAGSGIQVGTVLHPSPASPTANQGWAAQAEQQLRALGVRLPEDAP